MNILILNWKDIKHPEVGGAEIIVYELAKRLVKNGHNVSWFCRSFFNSLPEENIAGIRVVRRGNLVTTYLHAPFYYWNLEKKPDLIIDMSNTIYWQTPLWAFKSKKIAYLNQLAKEVFYYEYPPLIRHLGLFFESLQYLTYQKTPFLCYAVSTKDDLVSVGIPVKNIHVFPLGIDHSRYYPGKKASYPLFICVNRLVKMKRTDLVIKAMTEVVKKYPKSRLIIVGYGYERTRLEQLRNQLGLASVVKFADENILFFEKTQKDRKVQLMQQAWSLVFPSVKEGWGMTVTECAACATPAIVTDVSGLRDSVMANKTGLVVSSNPTPEEIASAILRLIRDPQLLRHLSKDAQGRSSRFTWENSFKIFNHYVTQIVH